VSSSSPNFFLSESNRIPAQSSRGASDSDRLQRPREREAGASSPSRLIPSTELGKILVKGSESARQGTGDWEEGSWAKGQ
jgi:hypothetical protein